MPDSLTSGHEARAALPAMDEEIRHCPLNDTRN